MRYAAAIAIVGVLTGCAGIFEPAMPAGSRVWLISVTDEEKAAMRNRAQELKAEARANKNKANGESAVLAAIAAMPEPERAMAKRLHAIIKASAPALSPKTWYGMPAYAKDGKVVCFFQSAKEFNTRYATFGFSDEAKLDEGAMWPNAFALTKLTAADLVTLAMNGWGEAEPAWWLNLQAKPDATVKLRDGTRAIHGRAAQGEEHERLWARWREMGDDVDGYATRRPAGTAVVVLEPRPASR